MSKIPMPKARRGRKPKNPKEKAVSIHTTVDYERWALVESSGMSWTELMRFAIDIRFSNIRDTKEIELAKQKKDLEEKLAQVKGELEYKANLEKKERQMKINYLKQTIRAGIIISDLIEHNRDNGRITMRESMIKEIYGISFDYDALNRAMAKRPEIARMLDMDKEDLAHRFDARHLEDTVKNLAYDQKATHLYREKYGFDVDVEGNDPDA